MNVVVEFIEHLHENAIEMNVWAEAYGLSHRQCVGA